MINPGTTASLICPACGQAFLSMQQGMAGMVQCPHCAHSASRADFGTQAQVAGVQQVRRRVAQTQPMPGASPPVFEYYPPVFTAPAPQPMAWPGAPPAQEPAPQASVTRGILQPSQALMPVGEPPPPTEFTPLSHTKGDSWKAAFILLSIAVVCGGGLWLWWDQTHTAPVLPGALVTPPITTEIRPAQAANQAETRAATHPPPDEAAISADVKSLVAELFAADTPERRAACIHEAEEHTAEIEALFGSNASEKVELRLLARIPGLPLMLPGGQPAPIFKMVTSRCANGALIRLETGADGKRRIDWPMFHEMHQGSLEAFLKQPGDATAWFHVGLRPSHGLDIPSDLRLKYLTFDVQTSATSEPRFVACVERDTPLGRFLDRESDWGRAYLSRLLVRRLDIKADALCMLIVDCEGASER